MPGLEGGGSRSGSGGTNGSTAQGEGMSHTVSLEDVPDPFRDLLGRIEREGGEILVTDGGRTVARVVAERRPGVDEGRIRVSDDFDAPLPPDVAGDFEA